jgi:UDP-N-acetylglucosamine--N-acetylmuramyl-(pentapeptide) pyrophosphoryl-undecaprenol N-acetylglucosamine transferase
MKVLLAVGGTGGHLFPAQAVAKELQKMGVDILFAGALLDENRFLDKQAFPYSSVTSATPFRSNPFKAAALLFKGIKESLALLSREKPDLVIGFGSYHSFPLLCAAKLKKTRLILFEADTFPGKVNRLFSRFALFSALAFPQAAEFLHGKKRPVQMPSIQRLKFDGITQFEARKTLGLDPDRLTLLVSGGSQGARAINQQIAPLLQRAHEEKFPLQLIHLTGDQEMTTHIMNQCTALNISCYVKEFDKEMGILWRAASVFIGRCGASTLSEMIAFEVPGILIPFPFAASGHQEKNARYLQEKVRGGYSLLQHEMSVEKLFNSLLSCSRQLDHFKEQMRAHKSATHTPVFSEIIYELLKRP